MANYLKKIGSIILKIIVFCVAWGYVVYKFRQMDNMEILLLFKEPEFSISIFAIICLLMFFNWFCEAYKWKKLVSKSQIITNRKAISGVLVGLPLALITPNRIGEIGGRAIVLDKHYKEAMFATFIGSLMQLSATLIFGLIGILIYLIFFPENPIIVNIAYLLILCVLLCCAIVFSCRHKPWLKRLILQLVGKKLYKIAIRFVSLYNLKDILQAFVLSIVRYCIFGGQFFAFIKMLIPELQFLEIFVGITIMYLITTIIPTSLLGEIGIRGSVAMFVFGFFSSSSGSVIFQISLLIWVINIAVPTLIGSTILLFTKHRRKKIKS